MVEIVPCRWRQNSRHVLACVVVSMMLLPLSLFADLLCGTWNLRWFPSGRAEHRAKKAVEEANITTAAATIRKGLEAAKGDDDVVLFFQELRNEAACSRLVAAIAHPRLSATTVSAFRDWDRRLLWQQCGIVTTLPLVETRWFYWRPAGKVHPPRGYVYAVLDGGKLGLIACFGVHLKSNYRAAKPEVRAQNARKREVAIEQIVMAAKNMRTRDGRGITHVLVAGDFNMDPFSGSFAGEKTVNLLTADGFAHGWVSVPPANRGTHPGRGRFADSTLDFIFHRGFAGADAPTLGPSVPVSDHRMVWQWLR